jgi:hypothetical protein
MAQQAPEQAVGSDGRVTNATTELGSEQLPRFIRDVIDPDPCVGVQSEAHKSSSTAAARDAKLELRWRDAGKVALKQHRGRGSCDFNHVIEFNDFNTFVADIKLSNGRFYYEVHVLDIQRDVQFGVCTSGFEPAADPSGMGVGDDSFSFAVDGARQLKWPGGSYGCQWTDGQVIGFAIDMRKEGCGRMSVSVGGSFAAPNGLAFDAISAAWLTPAFSASCGKFRINFGDSPFKHYPPDGFYMSVHEAWCVSNSMAPAVRFGSAASAVSMGAPEFKSPITLSFFDLLTSRPVLVSLVADGKLLSPVQLRAQIKHPLELIKAEAYFFPQRSPLCKRPRQEPLPPLGFMSAEYSLFVPVRFMCGCVATAYRRLVTPPAGVHVIFRTTLRWAGWIMERVTRGRVRRLQVRM